MLYCVDPTCPYYTELEPEHKNNYPASPVGKRSSVSVTTINNKCFDDDYEDSGSECYDDPRSETEIRKVHRFQELFRGRYSEHEAEVIIEHKNNDIDEAVNFIFEAEPREIRELLNTNDEWKTVEVKRDNVLKDLARRNHIEATFRQFGCSPCDKMWWRKVPSRKEVSRCKRCRVKYDAIPRDREWGWAKFDCHYCGHVFNGFGQVGTTATESPCYNCGAMCTPSEILPRSNKSGGGQDVPTVARRLIVLTEHQVGFTARDCVSTPCH
ncbi:hypothetical protein ScPMuIL_017641 [Solemya velum]